jgi:drug/metabolite transporter (DMT)-like permease
MLNHRLLRGNPGLLLLSVSWSMAFPLMTLAGETLSPFWVVALRLTSASVAMAAWMALYAQDAGPFKRQYITPCAILAVVGNALPFSLLVWAQQVVPSYISGLIISATPLFTLILAVLMGQEKLTKNKAIGCLLGLGGIVLITKPWQASDIGTPLTVAAIVVAALCYSITHWYGRQRTDVPAAWMNLGMMALGAALVWPLALHEGLPTRDAFTLPATLATLGLGLLPSAAAGLLMLHLLQTMPASKVALSANLIPFFSAGMGFLLLNEHITPAFWPALAVVVCGLWIARRT